MSMYTQNITLDLNTNTSYTVIGVKQNDNNSRAIAAIITENGQPFNFPVGASATYRIRKPNGNFRQDDAIINSATHEVTFTLKSEDLSIPGRCYADIVISTTTASISTESFIINVQASPDISASGGELVPPLYDGGVVYG